MPTGVFLDGPLKGEVMRVTPTPTFRVMLPPRVTVCTCDPSGDEVFPHEAETIEYHVVMRGIDNRVVMLSIRNDSDAVLSSLKQWVVSNFQAERWYKNCRDERAWE